MIMMSSLLISPAKIISSSSIFFLFFFFQKIVQGDSAVDNSVRERVCYFFLDIASNNFRTVQYLSAVQHVEMFLNFQALEKSKYEQSLESVRHFIAIAEKELELYYRHIALYGDSNSQSPNSFLDGPKRGTKEPERIEATGEGNLDSTFGGFSPAFLEAEIDSTNSQLSETEDDSGDEDLTVSETDVDDDNISCNDFDSCDEVEDGSYSTEESSTDMLGSSLMFKSKCDAYNQ